MDSAEIIQTCRRRAGLTLRELAERAGTSHATLSAYEHGRVVPRVDTLVRIAGAAGFAVGGALSRRRTDGVAGPGTKARELWDVLELASELPSRPKQHIHAVFGRSP